MPEFIPQHALSIECDAFTRGYLECMEWLIPEECDIDGNIIDGPDMHERMTGFAQTTLSNAAGDCADFQAANADLLEQYTATGHDMAQAGRDFYLSRNGHGSGYFDRGDAPCFEALQHAARVYSTTYEYLDDFGLLRSE